MSKTLFIPNVACDRAFLDEKPSPKIVRMEQHFAPLLIASLTSDYSIYSAVTVCSSFFSYLRDKGVEPSDLTTSTVADRLLPWGVTEEIVEFAERKNLTFDSPPAEIVKNCNSRRFQERINNLTASGVYGSKIVESMEDLEDLDRSAYVLKPNFGNAGSGFLHLGEKNSPKSLKDLAISKSSPYLYEPWLNKDLDIATYAHIPKDQPPIIYGHHRNISNRAGSFYANLLDKDDPELKPYRKDLDEISLRVCLEIQKAGYFGPIGFDSITYYCKDGEKKLAAIIDINARHTIATLSYGIWRKRGAGRPALYRFIARRRLDLPNSYSLLERVFKEIERDNEIVLLATPLQIELDGQVEKPLRSAFYLEADTIEDLFNLDERLRKAILKK